MIPLTRRDFVAGSIGALASASVLGRADACAESPMAATALAEYVGRVDPATRFDLVGQGELPTGEWLTGRLTSQKWQGVEWVHELSMFRPTAAAQRGPVLLWIDAGASDTVPRSEQRNPSDALKRVSTVATAAGLPVAVIRQVPYQPMFDGLAEDALIAHSFVQFARTGDPTWPLLLPMVKAAVKAMNAVEEVATAQWGLAVDGHVVSGASKRGWTTWLAAAADDRIRGFVPAVIDLLSMKEHLMLQRASFGALSDKLVDYTSRGIDKLFGSPRGDELMAIVDPLTYRAQLTQPKIIALGTNDPYWPIEACALYYDKLEGPRWVSHAPNAGHGLPAERLAGLIAGMGRHVAGLEKLPDITWSIAAEATGKTCLVACPEAEGGGVVAWTATAPTRDFRKAVWQVGQPTRNGDAWQLSIPKPGAGFGAGFVEVRVPRNPLPLVLTSGVAVVGAPGEHDRARDP